MKGEIRNHITNDITPLQIKEQIINDSVRYKILEVKQNNLWKRDLNIYLNGKISNTYNILYKKQKELHLDSFHEINETKYNFIDSICLEVVTIKTFKENFEVINQKQDTNIVRIKTNGNLDIIH